MLRQPLDRETLLEFGVGSFLFLLVVGVTYLLFGDTIGRILTGRRRREGPPRPGSVPPERHANITGTAAR